MSHSSSTEELNLAMQFRAFAEELNHHDESLMVTMLGNFEKQARGESYQELSAKELTAYNQVIHRMLTKTSTVSSGFLLWLDFSSDRNATMDRLLTRPMLLPPIPGGPYTDEAIEKTKRVAANIAR